MPRGHTNLATVRSKPLTRNQRFYLQLLWERGKIHPDNQDTVQKNVLRSLEARGLGRWDQPMCEPKPYFVLTDTGREAARGL